MSAGQYQQGYRDGNMEVEERYRRAIKEAELILREGVEGTTPEILSEGGRSGYRDPANWLQNMVNSAHAILADAMPSKR